MVAPVTGLVRRAARRLRFPRLVLLTAVVFVADVLVPDVIPFVDEILLGLLTVLLASIRRRPAGADPRPPGS